MSRFTRMLYCLLLCPVRTTSQYPASSGIPPTLRCRYTGQLTVLDTFCLSALTVWHAMLCCTVLCCAVLCCVVLYCTVLYWAVLSHIMIHYASLCCAMSCHATRCIACHFLHSLLLFHLLSLFWGKYLYSVRCTFWFKKNHNNLHLNILIFNLVQKSVLLYRNTVQCSAVQDGWMNLK